MKYMKTFGLAALAAALMALVLAGNASATTLTGVKGAVVEPETVISAEAETTVILHPPIGDIECKKSTVSGKTTNKGELGNASVLVSGNIKALTFTECNAKVVVLEPGGSTGVLSIEGLGGNNGTLRSTGTEVTVEFAGFHCIFSTNQTDIGELTGSESVIPKGSTSTFDIKAKIPRTGGRSGAFCGTTAEWTGSYKITSPDTLNVDK